jgi:glycosyltransferase involved in cell wall biosynthesis
MTSLIKAFAILKQRGFRELQLVVAGHPPKDKRMLELLVQDHRLLDAVIFTGYVGDDVLPTLYAYAEAFIFPSLYEGFGIPVLEAFLYGAPVACSNAAALPEIGGDAACYFDPTHIEEMADVISRLICSEDLRKSLIKKGKERVIKFTWEETARKTLEVYRRVAGRV